MEARSANLALLCTLQLLLALCTTSAINIDLKQPIVRTSPSPDNEQADGHFGYSMVLHQIGDVQSMNRMQALANTRIVVSAPRLTVPGGQVDNTGAVYTCPINPGVCGGLMGTGTGLDRRLYDTEANGAEEEKLGQFLGGSMASNEDSFIVCAHRFTRELNINLGIPIGRCYATTNQALEDFEMLQPCPLVNDNLNSGSAGICEAGTSSVITRNGNNYVYGLGAPGYFSLAGVIIRVAGGTAARQGFNDGTERDSYQGYAIAAGYFLSTAVEDYAVSVPKSENYFGRVNIVTNTDVLSVVSQPDLMGQQLGEYYGFSLLRANIRGDGLDELLVGAPMFRANGTQPDTGRVYVYNNVAGRLTLARVIEGFDAFSRFGYAMANMGDLNGDGYDDVAIGAPFSGSGSVYIYHSSRTQTLTLSLQQVIVGSQLQPFLSIDISLLKGFGTSLASGVDVDENSYNDLAIGSFLSQQVFLLRTRPLAFVTRTLTATPQLIDLEVTGCSIAGSTFNLVCFDVRACITYSGSGLNNQIDFDLNIVADANNAERRISFGDLTSPSTTIRVTANAEQQICRTVIAYVLDGINDIFNPFLIDLSVGVEEVFVPAGDGNDIPRDLSDFPVVSSSGIRTVQVQTVQNCGGEVCVPNLRINVAGYRAVMEDGSESNDAAITVGAVRNLIINTDVVNAGEDAFQATIQVTVPSIQLEISRLTASLSSGIVISLTCPTTENLVVNNVDQTRVTCNIGNPLEGPDITLSVSTTLIPRQELVGNENNIVVEFSVSSINPEALENIDDNMVSAEVMIRAQADITIDPGVVDPEVLSYSNNPITVPISNVTQLGPTFTTSFVVRNSGPSTVRNISLVINWPVRTSDANGTFFLYPAVVMSSGSGATVTCMNVNINPANLGLELLQGVNDQEEGQIITGGGGGGKKRRKRSALAREHGRRLLKRQVVDQNTGTNEMEVTTNRTVSCLEPGETLICVPIQCEIRGLQGSSNARVDITGLLDERSFAESNDRFTIIPTAEIRIENADFLIQEKPNEGKTSMALVSVIPAMGPVSRETRSVPWWVIFLAILAAAIIIALVSAALWGLGFFKRRKHEELKQRKEELENLHNNGSGPGAASTAEGGDGTDM